MHKFVFMYLQRNGLPCILSGLRNDISNMVKILLSNHINNSSPRPMFRTVFIMTPSVVSMNNIL
jgi:hypothetical protein